MDEDTGIQLAGLAAHALHGEWNPVLHTDTAYLSLSHLLENQDNTTNILIMERHKQCK